MNLLRNLADFARLVVDEVLLLLTPRAVEVAPVVELRPVVPIEETRHG